MTHERPAQFARILIAEYTKPFDWSAWNADMDNRRDKLAATEREIAAGHAEAMATLGEAIALFDTALGNREGV